MGACFPFRQLRQCYSETCIHCTKWPYLFRNYIHSAVCFRSAPVYVGACSDNAARFNIWTIEGVPYYKQTFGNVIVDTEPFNKSFYTYPLKHLSLDRYTMGYISTKFLNHFPFYIRSYDSLSIDLALASVDHMANVTAFSIRIYCSFYFTQGGALGGLFTV